MFVIAHLSGRIPTYFWKKDSSGMPLVTVDLKNAVKFNTRQEAKVMLNSFPSGDTLFNFEVFEIGILR
jgi:hypothetical protein